jgi:hypothetical protein
MVDRATSLKREFLRKAERYLQMDDALRAASWAAIQSSKVLLAKSSEPPKPKRP